MAKSPTKSILKNQRGRLLLIAIALGVLAALLTDAYIKRTLQQAQGGPTKSVIVVSKAVDQGDKIQQSDLAERKMPVEYAPPRVLGSDLSKNLLDMGAVASRNLMPGQPLTPDDIQLKEKSSLSDYLAASERAVTLNVSNSNSFNNMIKPGDRIDILTMDHGGDLSSQGQMKMLLQNVYVLAVNDNLHRSHFSGKSTSSSGGSSKPESVNNITVRVGFQHAIKLTEAESRGSLTFLLRNRNDIFEYGEPSQPSPAQNASGTASASAPSSATGTGSPQTVAASGQAVKGYPVIYEEGQPVRSAYYPSENMMKRSLQNMNQDELEALKEKALEAKNPAPKPSKKDSGARATDKDKGEDISKNSSD